MDGRDDQTTRWLLGARAGDRASFASFVRATQTDVWRYCSSLVDPGAADDLAQDVFLRAYRGLDGYRGDGPARAWLLAIARRTCADEIRRRQRRRSLARAAAPRDVVHLDDHAAIELADLLAPLDADRREAFVLTQVLGLSYAEAAAVAEVPIGTIRSRVARAREELVGALGGDAGEPLPSAAVVS